jgi:hypothetical protein
MVVIAFFALDQLLREMPHSKLTYAFWRDFFFYFTRNYKDDGDDLPTFGGAMRIYFAPTRPSLLKDVEGLAAKYFIIRFNYRT